MEFQSGLPASLLSDRVTGSNSTASTLDTTTTTTMTLNSSSSQEELWTLLDHQFHLVTNFAVQDFHLSSAIKTCNVPEEPQRRPGACRDAAAST